MLLGRSGRIAGSEVNMDLVRDASVEGDGGVPHGRLLAVLCDVLAGKNAAAMTELRAEMVDTMGPDQFVDAVGVSAMFHMMNRVANATGTPLDEVMHRVAPAVADSIGAGNYLSKADTPI